MDFERLIWSKTPIKFSATSGRSLVSDIWKRWIWVYNMWKLKISENNKCIHLFHINFSLVLLIVSSFTFNKLLQMMLVCGDFWHGEHKNWPSYDRSPTIIIFLAKNNFGKVIPYFVPRRSDKFLKKSRLFYIGFHTQALFRPISGPMAQMPLRVVLVW